MVSIKKKIIDEKAYYYIEHSYRKNGQVHKKEKYLGTKIPKNIEKLKEDLLLELYQEVWFKKFDIIKDNFSKRKKNTPKSIEEKDLEYFAIIFTYTTNKIEGSTLTYRETALLLEKGITPANRSIEDIKEAEQHREVFYDMLKYDKKISMSTLLYWHKKIFQYTKKNKEESVQEDFLMGKGVFLDMSEYPEIYERLKEMSKESMLPIMHIVVSLVSKGLLNE